MQRFTRVYIDRRGSGTGQCGGNLVSDDAGFPDTCDDDTTPRLRNGLDGAAKLGRHSPHDRLKRLDLNLEDVPEILQNTVGSCHLLC